MDAKRLEDHKKWLDAFGVIYQRHADFMKLAAGGVVEYGKLIVQSLFALNGAGMVAVQFLFMNLSSDPIKKYSSAYLWAGGAFLGGFLLALAMALFMYQNFSALYKNGSAEYQDEVRIVHKYVFGNNDETPSDITESEHQIAISYKMAHLMAWFSVILFCIGSYVLVLKITEIV